MTVLPASLNPMTGAERDVLKQLWDKGPTWDGNVVSKNGRDALIWRGLVRRCEAHAFLTEDGVRMASGLFGAKDR